MKTEKFLASLFMLNLLLVIAVVYSVKSDMMLKVFEEIFYSKKVNDGFMTFSPDILQTYGFKTDPTELTSAGMEDIFARTHIKRADLTGISTVPPYDRAILITKMFSTMGDGVCNSAKTVADKIIAAEHKSGCSEDYAEIFTVLARYTGLKTRIVKNDQTFAVEVFDGKKWFFIDPYYAMTALDGASHPLSYYQTADRLIHNKWIRFYFFGGQNHCMYGKPQANHPYYQNRSVFNSVYALMGDNVFEIVQKEAAVPDKPKFVKIFAPYREIKPYWIHATVGSDTTMELKKFVSAGLVLWILLFLASDVILPVYFIWSKIRRKRLTL